MRSPSKKRFLSVIPLGVVVLFFLTLFVFRNALISHVMQKVVSRSFPGFSWRMEKLTVDFGRAELKNLSIRSKPGSSLPIEVKDVNGLAQFLTLPFWRGLFFEGVQKPYCDGVLTALSATLQDIAIRDLRARFELFVDAISINEFTASVFGGQIRGEGHYLMGKDDSVLSFVVRAQHIGLKELFDALKVSRGIEAKGDFSGDIQIVMEGKRIRGVSGNLRADGGGSFFITDTSLLDKRLSETAGANIVVENLKNYYYDIGSIKISNNGQGIKLEIFLQGQSGARNLEIVWHVV